MPLSREDIDKGCRRVDEEPSEDFAALVKAAGLDPKQHLRHADWSGVSFRGTDLRGFDFTAARLHDCDFSGAKIAGACFAQAELGAVLRGPDDNPHAPARLTGIANPKAAADWNGYLAALADSKTWAPPGGRCDPSHLPVGAIFSDAPGVAPELVVVPPGSFLMGSPDGSGGINGDEAEKDRYTDEGPRREVTFVRPFAIGRYLVTVAEFGVFEAAKKDGLGTHPVTEVSWNDAVAYCDWLNGRLGLPKGTYRLPSEAEWEYCCRAGTQTRYWWGDEWDSKKANNGSETTPVDRYKPNGWGLHDTHGNVWEWCEDVWHDSYEGAPLDGSAWTVGGNSSDRVIRGGSWSTDPQFLRSALRNGNSPTFRNDILGFRLARTL